MDDAITVRNPLWVKALIVLGLPGFAAGGAYFCWLSWKGGFGMSLEDILLAAFGAFCLVVAVKGLPLLRFLNHTATVHALGLVIARGEGSHHFSWEQLGAVEASDTFQVLGIYDRAGRLVYAVDYYAENFGYFAGRLSEAWSSRS
jgi:hypothetical protein